MPYLSPSVLHLFFAVAAIYAGILLLSAWAKSRPTLGVRLHGHWGSVYVLQDLEFPHLVKVGTTKRLVATRMNEVSETMTGGCKLRTVFAIELPYAVAAETIAHNRLHRLRHRSERGREWYRLRCPSDMGRIVEAVRASGYDVRRLAIRQHRWSPEADAKAKTWRLAANGPRIESLFGR